MNLQWNHWAALASVMLGETTARGTGRVESSVKSNSKHGTIGRPKRAHILSQLSLPAHPSNPLWTVTRLSSAGAAHILCLLLLSPLAYTVSPCQPHTSVPPSLYCNLSFLRRAECCGQRGNTPGACWWRFHPSSKTHTIRFVWDTQMSKSLMFLVFPLKTTAKLKLSKNCLTLSNASTAWSDHTDELLKGHTRKPNNVIGP